MRSLIRSKAQKAVFKYILTLVPAVLAACVVFINFFGVIDDFLIPSLILGAIASLFYVLYNINQYDEFKDIELKDFLECKHHFVLKFHESTKVNFEKLMALQLEPIDVTYLDDKTIEVISRWWTIRFKESQEQITLSIFPKGYISYPDSAKRYKVLRKVISELNERYTIS